MYNERVEIQKSVYHKKNHNVLRFIAKTAATHGINNIRTLVLVKYSCEYAAFFV